MDRMTAVPIERDASSELSRAAEAVARTRERLTLTRDGEPLAVMVAADELAALEETVELMNTPDAAAAIDEGLDDLAAGREYDGPTVLTRYLHRD